MRLRQDAGGGRVVSDPASGLEAIDVRDCSVIAGPWSGVGGAADCLLVQQAETRFGDGNGLYDLDEQANALNQWYQINNGVQQFYGQPLSIRLGIELAFEGIEDNGGGARSSWPVRRPPEKHHMRIG